MDNVHFRSTNDALETLRMATEAAAVGIWDLNLQTGELHWSQRCREIFGIGPEVPLRYPDFLELLHPSERDAVDGVVQGALDPNGTGQYDVEYRIVRPDGTVRWAAAKGRASFEEIDGTRRPVRFMGTILDRTEQRQSHEALIRAEQMAATGRLAASIAHEINNPLEAVTNLLYLARQEDDPQHRNDYLSQAESELARVSEIAANTLRFNRNPAGSIRIDCAALMRSVLSLFHGRFAMGGVTVKSELDEVCYVTAVQGELRQVVVNLVDNAIDATPRGGTVVLRCRMHRAASRNSGSLAVLSVADTGEGMSPEVLRHISEPFYTTKGSSGTGLGLWLSTEIIRRLGFKLKVKSRPGAGTVFTVVMPAEG